MRFTIFPYDFHLPMKYIVGGPYLEPGASRAAQPRDLPTLIPLHTLQASSSPARSAATRKREECMKDKKKMCDVAWDGPLFESSFCAILNSPLFAVYSKSVKLSSSGTDCLPYYYSGTSHDSLRLPLALRRRPSRATPSMWQSSLPPPKPSLF